MNDDIKDTRQPLVTSLGIILGFLLNFLAQWAISDDASTIDGATDWVIVVTLFVTVALMLMVLFRTLTTSYELPEVRKRYSATLGLYLVAIALVSPAWQSRCLSSADSQPAAPTRC